MMLRDELVVTEPVSVGHTCAFKLILCHFAHAVYIERRAIMFLDLACLDDMFTVYLELNSSHIFEGAWALNSGPH